VEAARVDVAQLIGRLQRQRGEGRGHDGGPAVHAGAAGRCVQQQLFEIAAGAGLTV
jgi:hypothetical protein